MGDAMGTIVAVIVIVVVAGTLARAFLPYLLRAVALLILACALGPVLQVVAGPSLLLVIMFAAFRLMFGKSIIPGRDR